MTAGVGLYKEAGKQHRVHVREFEFDEKIRAQYACLMLIQRSARKEYRK